MSPDSPATPVPDPAYIAQTPQHPMQRPHPEGYTYRLDQQLPAPSDEEMELAMARPRERFAHRMTPPT